MLRNLFSKPHPEQHEAAVERVSREAEANRRLAIYDRDTGLYAYWYLTRRIDEEAQRAERYGHAFSLMLIRVEQGNNCAAMDKVTEWLSSRLRSSDLVTHLGDGRYLALLPETAAPKPRSAPTASSPTSRRSSPPASPPSPTTAPRCSN